MYEDYQDYISMYSQFDDYTRPAMMYNEGLVKTILECEAVCERMLALLKSSHDAHMRVRQRMLLRDCADICGLTARFVAHNSIFARHCAHICAMICEACGQECAKFPDHHSQHCAKVCFHCARECKLFSRM